MMEEKGFIVDSSSGRSSNNFKESRFKKDDIVCNLVMVNIVDKQGDEVEFKCADM
jgi:hypothetical protein